VPIRSEQNDSLGLVPAPGWDGRYDWQGFVPADKSVSIVDPPSGRIATANNKTAPDDYPYTLTRDWESNYRYDRIESLLGQADKQSLTNFAAIQTDKIDNYALALKVRFAVAGPFSGDDAAAARLIETWNGAMEANASAPLIWAAWTRALARRLYGDELGANFAAYWGYRDQFMLRVLDDIEGESRWCDDRATPDIEDCASRIRLALRDALTELSASYGTDMSKWRWGDAHKAIHRAQPFGLFPYVGKFFNREVEMDGGPYTLLRADNNMRSDRPYAAIHGAGYRGIYDLANPDNSLYIISTGQSGNLFSPHYDDLLSLWAKGGYIAIPTQPDAVATTAVNRLVLEPETAPLP
jgi:penicillin amidase